MAIYCVVFELRREHEEYRQFFKHLDAQQSQTICGNCRLLFSRNSADAIKSFLENFIYPSDRLFVGEMGEHWALNRDYEATEWLRELQSLNDARQLAVNGSDNGAAMSYSTASGHPS